MINWLVTVPPAYRWAATLAFAVLVVALSVSPGVAKSGDSVFVWLAVNTATPVQKIMHVAVYAVLTFLLVWTLQSIESKALCFTTALTISIGLGASLEWHQTNVPGRYGSVADVLLNLIGALFGLLAALLLL